MICILVAARGLFFPKLAGNMRCTIISVIYAIVINNGDRQEGEDKLWWIPLKRELDGVKIFLRCHRLS